MLVTLAVSVALNIAGGLLYMMRAGDRAPRPDIYRRDRETMFEQLATTSPELVMLGDSLTDRGEWHELLGRGGIANRGISGDTIAGATARLGPIKALRPKTIAIMLGINDLLAGRSVASCIAGYTKLLASLGQLEPQPRILVQTVLPVGDGVALSNDVVRELNTRLRALCAGQRCELLDVNGALAAPDGSLPVALTNDGVHLNGEGYRQWADVLSAALAR
jgi:lysophospholipase L1-like esterase